MLPISRHYQTQTRFISKQQRVSHSSAGSTFIRQHSEPSKELGSAQHRPLGQARAGNPNRRAAGCGHRAAQSPKEKCLPPEKGLPAIGRGRASAPPQPGTCRGRRAEHRGTRCPPAAHSGDGRCRGSTPWGHRCRPNFLFLKLRMGSPY